MIPISSDFISGLTPTPCAPLFDSISSSWIGRLVRLISNNFNAVANWASGFFTSKNNLRIAAPKPETNKKTLKLPTKNATTKKPFPSFTLTYQTPPPSMPRASIAKNPSPPVLDRNVARDAAKLKKASEPLTLEPSVQQGITRAKDRRAERRRNLALVAKQAKKPLVYVELNGAKPQAGKTQQSPPPLKEPTESSTPKPSPKKPAQDPGIATWNDYLIKDVPSDGNCMLHAIKFELARKYPTHPMKDKTVAELRQMAADKAKEQLIAKSDIFMTYMRADMDEYNERFVESDRNKFNGLLKPLNKELDSLSVDLKEERLTPEKHEQATASLISRRADLIKQQDAALDKGIKDYASYIKHAEANGFWCGQMHLYALSLELNVPIHTFDSISKRLITFNPNQATGEPLELLCKQRTHYNVILGKVKDPS